MMNCGLRAAMQLNSVEGGGSDTPLRLIRNQPVLSDQTTSCLRSPASGKRTAIGSKSEWPFLF